LLPPSRPLERFLFLFQAAMPFQNQNALYRIVERFCYYINELI
jgi:hypothetical protein